jgi:DNA modification methylase
MGIEKRISRDTDFKAQKLEKTKARRQTLDAQRRLADRVGGKRRNDPLPDLEIRTVLIGSLREAQRKVRKLDPEHVERLVLSIGQFGFTVPILISGGEVLDGHVRLAAARALGFENVPAIDCRHLDPVEARNLRLAVNRLAEKGSWDIDQLRIEMVELIELEVDLDGTGFTLEEQDIILLDPLTEDAGAEEAEEPEPPEKPVSRRGDVWILDEHRVVCGNSLDPETYGVLLQGAKAQAVLTDPPYNVKIKGNVSGLGKKVHEEFVMASGELDELQWQQFLDSMMVRLRASIAEGAVVFAFMDWRSIGRLVTAAEAAGLKTINMVVWYKQSGGMGGLYRSAHELVGVFCNGERPATNNVALGKHGRDRTNVWSVPGANRRGSSASEMLHLHATPKPVELCVDALLDVTNQGDVVLDAFLGSGTTLVAAEQCGRRCYGIELDPRFVDVTLQRWTALTGKNPILAETEETFADVALRRCDDDEEDDLDSGPDLEGEE